MAAFTTGHRTGMRIRWRSAAEIRARIVAGALVCCLGSGAAAFADPAPDALHRAARISVKSFSHMLVGIGRAGDRLVAVGPSGIILLSDDSGKTWRQAASPTSVSLLRVTFRNAHEGWIIGHMGVVLHSTDGGATWKFQLEGNAAAAMVKARSVAAATQKLPDAGVYSAKAAAEMVADGPDKPFLALSLSGHDDLLVAGAYGLAFTSTNGGASWEAELDRMDDPDGFHIYGLARTGNSAFAVGEQGLLLRDSGDGYFRALKSPYRGTFFGALSLPDGTIFIYGLRGSLFKSRDSGASWKQLNSGASVSLTSAAVTTNGTVIFGSQSGQIIATKDEGETIRTVANAPEPIADITQASDGSFVVVGPRGAYRISDGSADHASIAGR